MTGGQEYINSAGSPSKKHRNLIQSRAGAAAVATNLFSNERKTVGSTQSQYNQGRSQAGKPRLNTHNGPRQMKGGQHVEPPTEEKTLNTNSSMKNQQQQQQEHQQTHWQKVSRSNHELTKLFYQLPGGQKSLVQNAIQSQNQQYNQQSNHAINNKKREFPHDKKSHNATPEMLEFLRERQDLPELQNQYAMSGLASSNKTPTMIPKMKQGEAVNMAQFQSNQSNGGKNTGFFEKSPHSLQNANPANERIDIQAGMMLHPNKSQTTKKPPSKARNIATGSFSNAPTQQRPQTRGFVDQASIYPSPLFKPQLQYNNKSGIEINGQRKIQDNYDAQLYRYENQHVNASQSNLRYVEMRDSNQGGINQMKTFQGNYNPKKAIQPQNRASQGSQPDQFYQVGGQTSFSNIYVGQALAAQQQQPTPAWSRYKGGSVNSSKIQVNSNLAHIKNGNDSRASRASLLEQQNNQELQNNKVDIMENKFIQEKLQNMQMNGDLREVSELNDQITAQINNAIRQGNHPIYNAGHQSVQQKLSFNLSGNSNQANSQINVYNNFKAQNTEQPLSQNQSKKKFNNVPYRVADKDSVPGHGSTIINSRQSKQELMQQHLSNNQLGSASRNGQGNRVQTANMASSKQSRIINNQITDQYLQDGTNGFKRSIAGHAAVKKNSSSNVNHLSTEADKNFIHVQRIVPSGSFTAEKKTQNSQSTNRRISAGQSSIQGPVTQIVNVHNQFNISNNIIIDPNSLKVNQAPSHTISGSTRFAAAKPPTNKSSRKTRMAK